MRLSKQEEFVSITRTSGAVDGDDPVEEKLPQVPVSREVLSMSNASLSHSCLLNASAAIAFKAQALVSRLEGLARDSSERCACSRTKSQRAKPLAATEGQRRKAELV